MISYTYEAQICRTTPEYWILEQILRAVLAISTYLHIHAETSIKIIKLYCMHKENRKMIMGNILMDT